MTEFECIMKSKRKNGHKREEVIDRQMLSNERLEKIVQIVNEKHSVTNLELKERLQASESTIRRDITALAAAGRVIKVHGGAMAVRKSVNAKDYDIADRRPQHAEAKRLIGQYAASLIHDDDLIYIDAGTSTEYLIESIPKTQAVFVTNAVGHAKQLALKGLTVYIIGGQMKPVTEAIVGSETLLSLNKYNFSKGFFGTNGISLECGLTTPDINEAAVKAQAVSRCKECYVLGDASKFDQISSVTFARLEEVKILTEKIPFAYRKYSILEVGA